MPSISPLAKLQASIQKEHGKEAAVFASDIPKFEIVNSGSLGLDYISGIGGLPHNRVIEIAGPEGSGKTTLGLHIIKRFLQRFPDRGAAICDMEHRITAEWVETHIGPELMDRLLVLWPDNAEQSTDIYLECVRSSAVSVFMYDSIGGSPSQRITEKSATVGNIGGNALAMTRFAQFASIFSHKYDCLTICINQIRDDMGGYNRLITPGGHGLKHAYSLRIHLKPGKDKFYDEIDGEKVQVGYNVVVKIVKNSLAAPYRATHYLFYYTACKYGFGIDTLEETVRLGILTDVIRQGGRWYNHPALPDGKVGSRDLLIDVIRNNEEIKNTIVNDILTRLSEGPVQGISTTFDPDEEAVDDPESRLAAVGYENPKDSYEEIVHGVKN